MYTQTVSDLETYYRDTRCVCDDPLTHVTPPDNPERCAARSLAIIIDTRPERRHHHHHHHYHYHQLA